jgi:predicted  nucleic acid-binding Zn-ribbon protein
MSLQNEFRVSELISSGSAAITSQNSEGNHTFYVKPIPEDFDGQTSGYVERPKYNEEELKKAVDVEVDELIPTAPREQPKVVPQKTYDRLEGLYSGSLAQIRNLEIELNTANGEIQTLTTENENLVTQIDVERLLRATAENELDITNDKYVTLVQDFQNALSKGLREGIERVSLEAQLRGLQAEKQTFNELQSQLQNQLDTANGNISELQNQLVNSQQLLAAAQTQASAAQSQAAIAQSAATQAQLANTKKKKIICNELYNQGFLPEHIWNADERYGNMMFDKEPKLVLGYMMWAKNVVKFMKEKPKYTKWIYRVVKPWTEHMAYEMGELPNDNLIGKIIHNVGKQYCYYVYNKTMSKRNIAWQ